MAHLHQNGWDVMERNQPRIVREVAVGDDGSPQNHFKMQRQPPMVGPGRKTWFTYHKARSKYNPRECREAGKK